MATIHVSADQPFESRRTNGTDRHKRHGREEQTAVETETNARAEAAGIVPTYVYTRFGWDRGEDGKIDCPCCTDDVLASWGYTRHVLNVPADPELSAVAVRLFADRFGGYAADITLGQAGAIVQVADLPSLLAFLREVQPLLQLAGDTAGRLRGLLGTAGQGGGGANS
jgi:hypothetical protein